MNTLPQAPKSFDRFEGQDHGTRGNSDNNGWEKEILDEDLPEIAKRDKFIVNEAVADGIDEYLDSLSAAQLEDEADKILAESNENMQSFIDEREEFYAAETGLDRTASLEELMGASEVATVASRGLANKANARKATLDEFEHDDPTDFPELFARSK